MFSSLICTDFVVMCCFIYVKQSWLLNVNSPFGTWFWKIKLFYSILFYNILYNNAARSIIIVRVGILLNGKHLHNRIISLHGVSFSPIKLVLILSLLIEVPVPRQKSICIDFATDSMIFRLYFENLLAL